MARLSVSTELMIRSLFREAMPMLEIRGASFDGQRGVVELDIVGPGVPEVERVMALCHVEKFTVTFEPITA